MFNIFKSKKKNLKNVIEQQVRENTAVIQSLKDYDEGKKDISTSELEQHLPNIRVTS